MKRQRANQGLPKYVYRVRGWYVYRPYLGRAEGKSVFGKDQRLCKIGSSMRDLYEQYDSITVRGSGSSVQWLLSEYHKGRQFAALSLSAQKDYDGYFKTITSKSMKNGKTFGQMPLTAVRKTTIRSYLDNYKGGEAPVSANRQIQYLKSAWNWAEERYEQVPRNPCTGVSLNKCVPRTRYVTQAEFQAFAEFASKQESIPIFMELAYLCRARWGEVAALTVADCVAEGIILRRGKGSEGEITAWTPRLRAAVKAAKSFNKDAPSPVSGAYLIHDRAGLPITRNGFQSAWGRAMRKWDGERFTFHDLKAAGYSDQAIQDAGHKSARMHGVYNRKLRLVVPAE